MINDFNIKIFDFVFSTNCGINGNYLEKSNDEFLCSQLDEIISKACNKYDFWQDYKRYFNDKCVIDATTMDGKEYIYNGFPRMKLATKEMYFNYKMKQLKKIIDDNGAFLEEKFQEITENIINVGKKEILDYCEQIGIIKYTGKVFIEAGDCPACVINYGNIKAVLHKEERFHPFSAENVVIFNGNENSVGNIEQNVNSKNNDDKLFELVLEKLELLEKEGVSKADLKLLKDSCQNKNKLKVVEILKDIASGTISSVVASGILRMLGL